MAIRQRRQRVHRQSSDNQPLNRQKRRVEEREWTKQYWFQALFVPGTGQGALHILPYLILITGIIIPTLWTENTEARKSKQVAQDHPPITQASRVWLACLSQITSLSPAPSALEDRHGGRSCWRKSQEASCTDSGEKFYCMSSKERVTFSLFPLPVTQLLPVHWNGCFHFE